MRGCSPWSRRLVRILNISMMPLESELSLSEPINRRPLRVREQPWVHSVTKWCLRKGFTPNSISLWSIVFSAIGAAELLLVPWCHWFVAALILLTVPIMLGMRGMCNLIDGLLAVEGGLKTKSGEVFNDVPDRISDSLLFVAAGYAASSLSLGWMAALVAVGTAYVRMLGGALRAKQYFDGPMAKQTRMAVLSTACLAGAAEQIILGSLISIQIGLFVIIIGSVWTIARRLRKIVIELESGSPVV